MTEADNQISIFSVIPEVKKTFFIDVFASSYLVGRKKTRLRLKTIEWEQVPRNLHVSLSKNFLEKFPLGTIFKLDCNLVELKNGKKYLSAIRRKEISPAIEFFAYNLKVQKLAQRK